MEALRDIRRAVRSERGVKHKGQKKEGSPIPSGGKKRGEGEGGVTLRVYWYRELCQRGRGIHAPGGRVWGEKGKSLERWLERKTPTIGRKEKRGLVTFIFG